MQDCTGQHMVAAGNLPPTASMTARNPGNPMAGTEIPQTFSNQAVVGGATTQRSRRRNVADQAGNAGDSSLLAHPGCVWPNPSMPEYC